MSRVMAKPRWIVPWTGSLNKPAIYHCISRVVDKRFALGPDEKEKFRSFMRMYEKFSGNRVLSYCLMSNHIHLLVEITPRPQEGLTDEELLTRVKAISSPAAVAELAMELRKARQNLAEGAVTEAYVQAIHERYTYRMHDLSEFMKGLMQRFTQWYNGTHERTGTLWERTFKSVVVEDGQAARAMAAYIDLNPVRAGIAQDPGDYRWSSYGEAVGGGPRGNGKRAREGLVRAWMAHEGWPADARYWEGKGIKDGRESKQIHTAYRAVLMAEGVEKAEMVSGRDGNPVKRVRRRGMAADVARGEREELERVGNVALAKRLRWRIRYFSDGVVIGSRGFVDELFEARRGWFGPKRRNGARRLRGDAAGLTREAGIFSLRDLGRSRSDYQPQG